MTNSAMALRAGKPVGVLLDPPYVMETQKRYGASEAEVNAVAQEAWEWALLNGERFRIAYCHKLGSFWFPDDWTVVTKRFTGRPGADPLRNMDAVAFSPACLTTGGE